MERISYDEYRRMVLDPETPEERILEYSKVEKGANAFDLTLKPDPAKVDMSEVELEFENAMAIGNRMARFRREQRLRSQLAQGDTRPLLVAEGDSWFQFPFLVREIIDHLGRDYLIACSGAAGDRAQNMVFGDIGRRQAEYLVDLRRHKDRAKAFLFSAAGNDIIGEDIEGGDNVSVLRKILKRPSAQNPTVAGIIDAAELGRRLTFLESAYRTVVANIRAEPGLERLPIVVHGYDYPFPHPWGDRDGRNPLWADRDQWLGSAFAHHGIGDGALRRDTIRFLIDALYGMLHRVAGDPAATGIHVVDCRGAMPDVGDWVDEIHGTSEGFRKVTERFRATLAQVL